ncbi:segregation/condensation protein A [Chungangia koreensis]|uniref:Segregation and condensation protein A n=1 Tax=Chungangia koreensis TaxID=752657 RepID=A0ABV8X4Z7_9LACT
MYNVKLDAFEGPLDLLLHLINRLEIDIYDIPMAELTKQYMEHIRAMQVLELNEVSEYLVMAATLLAIKSKTLLPIHEEETFETDFEVDLTDPREELVTKLLEYRKYKEAAQQLQEFEQTRSHFFTRPPSDFTNVELKKQPVLFEETASIYDMLGAFQKMLKRKQLQKPLSTKIAKAEISIKDRMEYVFYRLQDRGGKIRFFSLFDDETEKSVIIVTFLSLLELMKRQVISVVQEQNFEDPTVILQKEEWEVGEHETIDEQN